MRKILLLLISFSMLACQNTGSPQNTDASAKPRIVCTTGMLGDSAEVEVLMGPGVDPHLYKATQGDIQRLSQAQAIVYNGLHLEGKMGSIFEKLKHQKAVIAAGDMVSPQRLINSTDFAGAHDPHIWFDVSIWVEAMSGISRELQKLYPGWANYIIQNEINYRSELEELHNFCITHINKIPKDQRVMVTAHDAFKYFGRAYAIEVRGLQGISTTAEYGLQDVTELVNFISDHKSKGHPVILGGELFSDAMGEAGTPEGTYVVMVRHNVNTTVEALK